MPQYFTKETDEYIKKYLSTNNDEEKHELFNEGIRPAFEKLIENLIYVYKFFSLDDVETLKQDCLANLYEMLPKFNPDKGTKGFSYFNVVAKNWFIQKTRERAKKSVQERDIHVDVDTNTIKDSIALSYQHKEVEILKNEFWMSLYTEMDVWRERLPKKNDRLLLEAIIYLLQNCELISIYNKKAVYLYLREMTGLNEKQVAMGLKKIREMYLSFNERYAVEGC